MSEHDKPQQSQQNPLAQKPALARESLVPCVQSPLIASQRTNPFARPTFGFHSPLLQDPLNQAPDPATQQARPSIFRSLGLFDWFGSFGHPMATVTPQTPVQPIPGTDQAAENNPVVTSPTIALPTANKTEAKPGADPTKGTLKDKQTVNSQSPTRTNTATDKTEYDPSGKISNTISTTDRSTTKRGVTTERTSSDSSTVGYDNSTSDVSIGRTTSEKKTTTRKNGKVETSESSESVQANIDREGDGAGFTYAKYDKAEKDKGKTGQTTSANIDLGDKTSDISHSVSNNGVTNQGGIKTDKDGVSEVSYGRSVEDNGVTKGGGVKINRDGVTVDANYGKKDGIQTGGSVTIGPNKTAVSVSLGKGDNKGSLSYTNIHGEVKQEAVTKDDGTVAGDLLKGDGYLSTTRRDEVAYGGSLGAKNVGLSGDVRSGSALQLFAALPENWEKLPKAEQEKHLKAQKEEQAKIDGLANVDLANMKDGNGLRFTSYNGWNAGAGVSYGALSVNANGGRSSAHEVAIAKQDGQLTVSVARQDGLNSEAGLNVLGLGLKGNQDTTNTHRFNFTVDPKNPEAMQSMQTFLQTGLLPGADRGGDAQTKVATEKFQNARGEVDRYNQQLAELGQREKALTELAANPQSPEYQQLMAEKRALTGQMDKAQQTLALNRDFLNDQWESTNKPGSSPVPGVSVSTITDTKATSTGATLNTPIGNLELGRQDRTWTHQQYLSSQSKLEDRYGFNEKNYGIFGGFQDEHAAQTDTNTAGTVFAMYSNDDLKTNRDFVRSLSNKDIPDYALADPNFAIKGRTFIELNQQQLSTVGTKLNDMNDPKAKQMWENSSDRISNFLQGKKWYEDYSSERDSPDHQKNEFADQELNRNRFMNMSQEREEYFKRKEVAALNGVQPWASIPNLASGDRSGLFELQKSLSTVKSPADFQKLDPTKQQLFIRLMTETSGGRLNEFGQSNSFESIGPVSLIEDPKLRADELRQTFISTNEQKNDSRGNNGTGEFIKLIDRFKDDPATYESLKKGVRFDWQQEGVEALAGKSKEELQKQLKDAYNETSGILLWKNQDPNEKKSLDVLQAVNQQGGAQGVEEAIRASGADPQRLLRELKEDPVRQHMYYDLIKSTSYGAAVDPNELAFTP